MLFLLLNPLTALVLGLACGYFLAPRVVGVLAISALLGAAYAVANPLPEIGALITMAFVASLAIFTFVMLATASVVNRWWSKVDFSGLLRQRESHSHSHKHDVR